MARIAISGAGIIGCATAVHLIERGHDVTVFEKDLSGLPASVGNAGILAVPEIDPLARPDMLFSAPKWLADPLGPLTLRWQDLPALTPWLLAFLLAARPGQVERSRAAMLSLMRDALEAHERLAATVGISGHMKKSGALTIFDSESKLNDAFPHEEKNAALLGHEVEKLDRAAARAQVPALEGNFAGGIFSSGYQTFLDPLALLRGLQAFVRERGHLVEAEVARVNQQAASIEIVTAAGERQQFDKAVITSGIWSRDLVRSLGLSVLLETERGYNTTFVDPTVTLELPVFFSEHGFVATPLRNALRIGGAVELAKPDAPANFARAAAMRQKMRRYVPSLPESGGTEWMGRRPSTPDSIPVISLHPSDPRIAMAFGHGHLGLTLSAVTGRSIASLLEAGEQEHLNPFSIRRFQ
ncbi:MULTISPECIES: FAD-binding oxidoreductase [unclassified Rhizobium]|uniref:NAD(P)/FAD-dependent oxidoreductase n=1 Tax=unclassified Rhizobium TaxID=2613769 RepID=UPI0006F41EC1|nr:MULTISPECIES: FAD-binding oxidoreductase [unclassified Rhizobium]KQV34997.1 amino acid dehydrogenase [Rhizobium sp. Root1212]KRD24802.1 amino acid dehydrogenase [Rhizobium sp. Root268]